MAITNEEYEDFMKKIAERDKEAVDAVSGIIQAAANSLQESLTKLNDLRTGLPSVEANTQSAARSQIENVYNQITSFVQQLAYQKSTFDATMNQYNPTTIPGYTIPTK